MSYTLPAAWADATFDLELPSGGLVKAKQLQIEDVVDMGLLDNLDFYSAVVGQGPKPKSAKKTKAADAIQDAKDFKKMLEVFSQIAVAAVVEPKIYLPPVAGDDGVEPERVAGRAYADRIPLEDRMAIFNKCFADHMGGEAMDTFREKSEQNVGAVPAGERVEYQAELPTGIPTG